MASNNDDVLKQIAAALAAVGAGVGGRAIANNSGNGLNQAVPPQLSQLLDMSLQRQAYQNPLFQATTQGAYAMLPTFAKEGTQLSGSLPNAIPAAPAGSGGTGSSGPGLGTAASLGGLAALLGSLGSGSGGGGPLAGIFNAIKKLFGHGGFNPGTVDNSTWLPNYDPFHSNDPNNFPGLPQGNNPDPFGSPTPDVNTNEWMGQWPEGSDPFAPFDPSQLPGGSGYPGTGGDFGPSDGTWHP